MAHGRRCGAEDGRRGAPRPEHRCAGAQSSARVGLRARSGAPRRLRRCPLCLSPPSGPADRAATPRVIGAAGPCAQRSERSLIGSWGGVGGHCALWLPRGCAPGWRAPGWHKKVPPASGQSDPFGAKDGAAGAARGSGEILQTPQNGDQKRCSPFSSQLGSTMGAATVSPPATQCGSDVLRSGTGITHTGQQHHAGFVSHSQPWPGLVTGPKEQGKDVPGQHVSKHLSWHQENLCHSTTLLQCK